MIVMDLVFIFSEYYIGIFGVSFCLLVWFALLYHFPGSTKRSAAQPPPQPIPRNEIFDREPLVITPDELEEDFKPDVIIVGAGIAGPACAKLLSDKGKKVIIIERDIQEPNRIVGELLQPGGYEILTKMGLQDCLEEIDANTVYGYAVYPPGTTSPMYLPFPSNSQNKQFQGRSFHHGRFVQNLRIAAQKQNNIKLLSGTVTEIIKENTKVKGVIFKQDGIKKELHAPVTIICDGCFSNFRKKFCDSPTPTAESSFHGFIMDIDLPFSNLGNVFIADPAPVLCYTIGTKETRVLVDIPYTDLPKGGNVKEFLVEKTAPQLPSVLQDPFLKAVNNQSIRSMPCSTLPPTNQLFEGAILLGDALNMRHPLTGGGMTVAFSDSTIITNLLCEYDDFSKIDFKKTLNKFYSQRKPRSSTINTLAYSLYSVFKGSEEMLDMQNACMEYFHLGGSCVNIPMSLISGLHPSAVSLFYHYIRVLLYGIFFILAPIPTPKKIYRSLVLFKTALTVFFHSRKEFVTYSLK